jgi:hypothetical protein
VTILAIPVQNRVARRGVERKRFTKLLNDPRRLRMVGHREVHDPPSSVVQHYKQPQHSERDGRDGEEVHPDQAVPVIA